MVGANLINSYKSLAPLKLSIIRRGMNSLDSKMQLPSEIQNLIEAGLAPKNWHNHTHAVSIPESEKRKWIFELMEHLFHNSGEDQTWITSGNTFIHVQRLEDGEFEIQELKPVRSLILSLPAAASNEAHKAECICEASLLFSRGCQCKTT